MNETMKDLLELIHSNEVLDELNHSLMEDNLKLKKDYEDLQRTLALVLKITGPVLVSNSYLVSMSFKGEIVTWDDVRRDGKVIKYVERE